MNFREWTAPVGLVFLAAGAHAADESRLAGPEESRFAGPEAYASKPTAPIDIGWELSGEPRVGAPLTVSLTISAYIELAGATLTLGVDDPLSLIEPATETPLGTLVPGTPVAIDVTVLPLSDVTHYLRVAVAGESSGQPQMRSVSIAIRFDNAAAGKDPPGVASPAEAVHSLPAVETVR